MNASILLLLIMQVEGDGVSPPPGYFDWVTGNGKQMITGLLSEEFIFNG